MANSYQVIFLLFIALGLSSTLQAQPLSGSYTIDSTMPTGGTNFTSFTDLAGSLNSEGINGDVTVSVTAGTGPYLEQLVINTITGSGPDAILTLDGNGEILSATTSSTDRHVFRLANVSYVTVQNLKVEWDPASTGGFYGIQIFDSGQHITIQNCEVDLTGTTSTLYGAYIASGSETSILSAGNFQDITIQNNIARGGGYGASVYGEASNLSQNIVIADNQFFDFNSNGIYLRETDGVNVYGNFFDRTTSNFTSCNAIQLAQNENINGRIYANEIQVSQTVNGSFTQRGIYLFNGTGHQVYNNLIHNIQLTSGKYTAIEVRTGGTAPEIYFNTIVLDNENTTDGELAGFKETLTNTNSILRNNLISLTQPCTGIKSAIVLATNSSPTTAVDSDYNLLFVPDGNVGQKGTFSPTFYPTLANWQGISGGDNNSLSEDPLIPGTGTPVPGNLNVQGAGVAIPGITTDFLGSLRAAPPTIGALEPGGCSPPDAPTAPTGATTLCVNAEGVGYTTTPIVGVDNYVWSVPSDAVIVEGQGTTTIQVDFGVESGLITVAAEDSCGVSTPATLAIDLSDGPDAPGGFGGNPFLCAESGNAIFTIDPSPVATSYEWMVPAGLTIVEGQGTDTLTVAVGAAPGGMLSVVAIDSCGISEPAILQVTINPLPDVTFNLGIDTLCTDAPLFNLSGGSPGPGTYGGPGVSNDQFDAGSVGPGSYTLLYAAVDTLSGCTNTATATMVVEDCTGVNQTWPAQVAVFPNPTTDWIQIEGGRGNLRLTNAQGQLLFQQPHFRQTRIDASALPAGNYYLEYRTEQERWVRPILIQ